MEIRGFLLSPPILKLASERAMRIGKLNNSITEGEGNLAGAVGEIVVASYTGGRLVEDYNYNVLLGDIRIEVKTKRTTTMPKADFECSVAETNTKQACDLYAFVRVWLEMNRAWILGCISPEVFFVKARHLLAGQIDETSTNKFKVRANCYNIFAGDLNPLPCAMHAPEDQTLPLLEPIPRKPFRK